MKRIWDLVIINFESNRTPKGKLERLSDFLQKELVSLSDEDSELSARISRLRPGHLTCVFLSSSEMKRINFEFRKINKVTDVLTFESPDGPGELLFCMDQIKIQARGQRHSVSDELAYMFIHGVLHLMGYEHELSKKRGEMMFKLQDLIFMKWVNL